jgi:hypothetical protein
VKMSQFVDHRPGGEFDRSQAATMVKIAVACLEEERRRRPIMSQAVEALLPLIE